MSKQKVVKKALHYLQQAYELQIIGYPRVDRTYKTSTSTLDTFPHPPLPVNLTRKFSPLEDKIGVNVTADELLLFLTSIHVITPSQIEGVYEYICHYLNEELVSHTLELEKEAEVVANTIRNYLKTLNITSKELFAKRQSFYKNAFTSNINAELYEQNSAYFFHDDNEKKLMEGRWKWLASQKYPNSPTGGVIKVGSLREAIDNYEQGVHNNLSTRKKEQRETMIIEKTQGQTNTTKKGL